MKLSSLEDLGDIKKRFPKKREGNEPAVLKSHSEKSSPVAAKPRDEGDDFIRAMTGVAPLSNRQKGREIRPEPILPDAPVQDGAAVNEDAWVTEYLRHLVQGNVEFELIYSEEYMQGSIQGLDRRVLEKLKAGRFSVEAHQDLHGLNALQAREAALGFLRGQYYLGRRCVLLIPGRGRNSPGGQPLIREELPVWLTRDPLKRIVLAFCTALPKHGGAGALYILLRKYKKNLGKVRWDLPGVVE